MVIQIHHRNGQDPERVSSERFREEISRTVRMRDPLRSCATADMIAALQQLYRQWALPSHPMYHKYRHAGLAYLLAFIRSESLVLFLRKGLRHEAALDEMVEAGGFHGLAVPRGVVGHWMAGNVPLLCVISVLQAILTKNVSLVKLSSKQEDWLSPFLHSLAACGETGRIMADAVLVVSYPGEMEEIHREMASWCDVRIAWGGQEAVRSVAGLPGRVDSQSIVFGPKYSCSVVDPEQMEPDDWNRLALDIALFNQLACTSPHAVFMKEAGGGLEAGAKRLGEALQRLSQRPYYEPLDPGETGKVLHYRTAAWMAGEKLLCSDGAEWTLHLHDHMEALAGQGLRITHLYAYRHVEEIAAHLPDTIQTISHRLPGPDVRRLAYAARYSGVARLVPVGAAHTYDIPWDGMLVLDQLVRWIKVEGGEAE